MEYDRRVDPFVRASRDQLQAAIQRLDAIPRWRWWKRLDAELELRDLRLRILRSL